MAGFRFSAITLALMLPREGSRLGMTKFECVTVQQSVHVKLDSVTSLD